MDRCLRAVVEELALQLEAAVPVGRAHEGHLLVLVRVVLRPARVLHRLLRPSLASEQQLHQLGSRRVEAEVEVRLDVDVVLAPAEVEMPHVLGRRARRLRLLEDDLHRAAAEVDDADGLLRRRGVKGLAQVVDGHPAVEALVDAIEEGGPLAPKQHSRVGKLVADRAQDGILRHWAHEPQPRGGHEEGGSGRHGFRGDFVPGEFQELAQRLASVRGRVLVRRQPRFDLEDVV
mmetsp:Transcript_13307/g.22769  ORF Transcript_13307/g.22769 Transcript_13307/m.22769 type:complete len:232 (+) Transcript_13307:652-1347(+)